MPCQQSQHLELSLARRVIIFVVGVVESMLFAGTVFGWPQLVHVLKVEGLYSDMCDGPSSSPSSPSSSSTPSNSSLLRPSSLNVTSPLNVTTLFGPESPPIQIFNNTRCNAFNHTYDISKSQNIGVEQCDPQDERFALIYTITVGCYSLTGIFVGYLLHHAGLRVTRISGGTMMALSFLFLGITTKESPNWLFPAMVLMALGGNQLRMAVLQLCDLFPERRSTALTLLSGTYAASAALFLVFQYTAAAGVARAHVCWALTFLCVITTMATFLMPVHHIPVKDHDGQDEAQPKQKPQPLVQSLCSTSSNLHQYFFFVCLFAINVYQQTYNVWINLASCSVEEAGTYTEIFSYSNLITVFFGPLGGAFTDFMVRRAQRTAPDDLSRRVKEVQASFWPLLVTVVSTAVMYGCKFFLHPAAVYLSIICMVICRPCVIAVSTAFIRIRFPVDHFNRLMGIYGTVAAALMFLQYPHFIWAQHMYYTANGFVLVMTVLCVIYPIHLLFTPLIRHAVMVRDGVKENSLLANHATAVPDTARA